jgi:hypothetical protein
VSDWRRIVWIPGMFAVCRLPPDAEIALPPSRGTLFCLTRTDSETSVVCEERDAPPGATCEMGWSAFRLDGPIPFETTGVLASLSSSLAQADVGIFAISTYDTDVVLMKSADVPRAEAALRATGFTFSTPRF